MIMGHDGQWWREITIYLAIYRVDYNIEACGCYGHSAFVPGRLGRGCLSLCFILIAGDDRHTVLRFATVPWERQSNSTISAECPSVRWLGFVVTRNE